MELLCSVCEKSYNTSWLRRRNQDFHTQGEHGVEKGENGIRGTLCLVISETLRMGNTINAAWRKALKDVDIKGYVIPKGWGILTSFSSIHLDEESYENPYIFDPWRWKRKEGNPINFTPFGGGHRLCPGGDFSRLEVAIFLHHLVTRYREARPDLRLQS
ncbi:3-epi-6-deoxocathasterone 23-monooxygenase [Acorus gramineus]|uniref:3-epi-6-deoxocathasterone 23-monooxygenase n=1 Tax=Acorus gramineus TaxID=55184 RepID=A0AAV9A0S7_ACOGR|nr:3-epi-6-deoxocathasterone 23-monooxygenase [Acorus gramineus]